MNRLDWSDRARDDLAAIDSYWVSYGLERANQILDRIEAAAKFLLGWPHAGSPLVDNPARKWPVRRTPYILIYRVRRGGVEVLRVHHAAENWQPPSP